MSFRLVTTTFIPQAHFPTLPPLAQPGATKEDIQGGIADTSALLIGRAPDGDTLGVDFRSTGQFEGRVKNSCRYLNVDTRETHYEDYTQGLTADDQTDANLDGIGVTSVSWTAHRGQIDRFSPSNLQVRVLHRGKDKYGRVLGMPIRHDAEIDHLLKDGGSVDPTHKNFQALVESTVNYDLVRGGMAYTTFYKGVSPAEVAIFTSAYLFAKQDKQGLWSEGADLTNTGFYVRTLDDITGNQSLIHPVIFRRLVSYLKSGREFNPAGFINHLSARPDKLRKFKKVYTTNDIQNIRNSDIEDILRPEEYNLHDLFDIQKADDGKGYIIKLNDQLENYIRF